MCVVIYTFPPPFEPAHEIESKGQLRAFAGKIVAFEGPSAERIESTEDDDCCICGVDVEATLEGAPWRVERTEGYDWQLVERKEGE